MDNQSHSCVNSVNMLEQQSEQQQGSNIKNTLTRGSRTPQAISGFLRAKN